MIKYDGTFARRAWQKVTAEIKGAADQLAGFEAPFADMFEQGEPTRKFDKQLVAALVDPDWTWAWFEEWNARFDASGEYPETWPQLVPDDDEIEYYSEAELAAYRRREIAPLISHTAMMIAYRDLHLSKAHPQQKWRFVSADDVERKVAEAMADRADPGGLDELPPYFPGDRTTLRMERPIMTGKPI